MRFTTRTCTLASSSLDRFDHISYLTCISPIQEELEGLPAEDHQINGWLQCEREGDERMLCSSPKRPRTRRREKGGSLLTLNLRGCFLLRPTTERGRANEMVLVVARGQLAHRARQGAKIQMTAKGESTQIVIDPFVRRQVVSSI